MRLIDYLENYNHSCSKAFHMPGHKRNIHFADYLAKMGADIDFTEIDATDDLHHAQGILKTCMQKAEKLWHSQHSFFMVNGATGGILAGIRACTHYGDKVLIVRNCHKSVYNAIELFGLNAVYLLPDYIPEYDIYGSVSPKKIEQAIQENPDIRLIILTSPTYEGVISDIHTISEIAHHSHIPLLTDEAHGSHLDLSPYFTDGSVKNGSDISVQSLHKTLPSLTQSAIIHLNSEMVSVEDLQRQLAVFQTSSPSYLLMSSADACIEMIHDTSLFKKWYENLTAFKERIAPLQHLRILGYTDTISDNQRIFGFDYSKILISCSDTNITGKELQSLLKQRYHIDFEMCSGNYLLAMTSMADTQQDLIYLADCLLQTDRTLKTKQKEKLSVYITQLPQRAISLSDAVNTKSNISYIPIEQSVGRVSGEYIWIYPPGIPLITPCEIVSKEIADILLCAVQRQMNIQHTLSPAIAQIAVISETI